VLTRATARLVAVTATAQIPQPPLAPGTSPGWGLAVAVAGILVGLAVAGAVAQTAFREPLPARGELA